MERHADVDALQVVFAGADDLDCRLVHEGVYGWARPGGRGTVEYTGAAGRGKGEARPAAPLCGAVSPASESRYGPGVTGRAELPARPRAARRHRRARTPGSPGGDPQGSRSARPAAASVRPLRH